MTVLDQVDPAPSHSQSSDDLWSEAISLLNDSDRQFVQSLASGKTGGLSDLFDLAQRSYQESVRKRWKYVRKTGELVIVRDLFAKIIKWLDIFKQIGDEAVQYDPEHPSLPWAGIRVILQMAIGDVSKYGPFVQGVSKVSYIIARCTILELQHLPTSPQTTKEMRGVQDGGRLSLSSAIEDSPTRLQLQHLPTPPEPTERGEVFLGSDQRSVPSAIENLRDSLTHLYAAILALPTQAKRFIENCIVDQFTRSSLDASDFEISLAAVENRRIDVDRCVTLIVSSDQSNLAERISKLHLRAGKTFGRLETLLEDLNAPLARVDKQMTEVFDALDRLQRTQILLWLSPQPYLLHHEQAKRGVIGGTGKWLLADPALRDWRESSTSSILWVHGIPGSGKTKLMSIVIEESNKWAREERSPHAAFFYCLRSPNEADRSNPEAILASIARQLSSLSPGSPIFDEALEVFTERERTGFASGPLSLEESLDLIIQLSCHYPVLTLMIDALDERDIERREDLFDALGTLLRESPTLVKIMVTSREDQDISWRLKGHEKLELDSSKNAGDIKLFVEAELGRMISSGKILRRSQAKVELTSTITKALTTDAHGMFRWVSMQLGYPSTLKLDSEVRERLGSLPPKLEELYSELHADLFQNTSVVGRQVAQNVFKWLLCACWQLSTADMILFAQRSLPGDHRDLTKDHILEFGRNFITLDSSCDTFRFSHLSVREFLERQAEYSLPSCNALVAEVCLIETIMFYNTSRPDKYLLDTYGINSADATRSQGGQASALELDDNQARRDRARRVSTEIIKASHLFDRSAEVMTVGAVTYALTYWSYHCEEARDSRRQSPLQDILWYFLLQDKRGTSRSNAVLWCQDLQDRAMTHDWHYPANRSNLYSRELRACATDITAASAAVILSSAFGFAELIEAIASQKLCPLTATNYWGPSALTIAADLSQIEAMKALLKGSSIPLCTNATLLAMWRNTTDREVVIQVLLDFEGVSAIEMAAKDEFNGLAYVAEMLRHSKGLSFTGKMLEDAISNKVEAQRIGIIKVLMSQFPEMTLSDSAILQALNDPLLDLLLDCPGQKASSHETILQVISSLRGEAERACSILRMLLVIRWPHQVTEDMVLRAIVNSKYPPSFLQILFEFDGDALISLVAMGHIVSSCPALKLLELLALCGKRLALTTSLAKRADYKVAASSSSAGMSKMMFPWGDDPFTPRPFYFETSLIDLIPDRPLLFKATTR